MVLPFYNPVTVPTDYPAGSIMENWVNYITIIILTAALFGLILADSQRLLIIAFGAVILVLFSINVQFWTFGFALSKLLTGIMSMLILVLTPGVNQLAAISSTRTGRTLNVVAFIFCILLVLFTLQKTSQFLGISYDQVIPALFILLCGFIMLGVSQEPYRIIFGLLTVITGFEVLYGAVEKSLLINGLLTVVVLLVALVGSYLLTPEPSGEDL